ncbi:MAG: GNAT family N-acetyltransferase [Anaerolineae bacterium]|nr:GNAT family N-acetyltransferase [Anaerolineae bacterium]
MMADDIGEIAAWMVQVPLWQRYRLTTEIITNQFQTAISERALLYVIEVEGQTVVSGFAWYLAQGAFGRSAYLKQIGVHPDSTGLGIGRQLLAHVEEACKQFSDQLFLLVSDFNKDAQKFYERQDYQHCGTIPAYVLPDVAELIYHKRLLD